MAQVAEAIEGDEGQAVVVMHSSAGLFASQFAASSRAAVAALVFVDTSVPPESGEADVVPLAFLAELRAKAVNGLLPRWTDWWADEDVAAMFPDAQTRRRVTDEQPCLPLSY